MAEDPELLITKWTLAGVEALPFWLVNWQSSAVSNSGLFRRFGRCVFENSATRQRDAQVNESASPLAAADTGGLACPSFPQLDG